ncbi:MAG: hypothetical protein GY772_19110 [bacterium]|jgi:hypothetical protein|nr:hypothetical protein [Deltaproteobacteria bacterium]MCP4242670.1 hypothetical protein [bacterium]|tara:strand:- start:260 stop:673 length:414 start_codon:yes stop_codon:yes gene_type:complete
MGEATALRAAPWVTRDSEFFWEAARREELVAERCADCGILRSPPRPMCPHCNSVARETQVLSGRGSIYTWVIPRYPVVPGFEGTHIVAVIDLEEGIRLVSNICEIAYEDITADMPVEVFFEPMQDGYKIPLFRPAAG